MFLLLTTNTLFLIYYHFLTFNYLGRKRNLMLLVLLLVGRQKQHAVYSFTYVQNMFQIAILHFAL